MLLNNSDCVKKNAVKLIMKLRVHVVLIMCVYVTQHTQHMQKIIIITLGAIIRIIPSLKLASSSKTTSHPCSLCRDDHKKI